MHHAARLAAAIEVLAECEVSWAKSRPLPADILLNRYFKSRRYIGSKDRGAIAELVYFVIRHRAAISWWTEKHERADARTFVIAAEILHNGRTLIDMHNFCNGDAFSPAKLTGEEIALARRLEGKTLADAAMPDSARLNYPDWIEEDLRAALGPEWQAGMEAMNREAPVDLRANTLLATRDELLEALQAEGYAVEPAPHSPVGVRMRTRAPVFTSQCFKRGWFEMQDEGSQLAALLAPVRPGDKVIDFCAGAGGKTLALCASMKNKGRLLAWDTSEKRLDQMKPRLTRAKADNVQRHVIASEGDPFIKRHKASADCVVVDAPCSGSGTWRRNPDLKWRFRQTDLAEVAAIQRRILESAARLVKPSGYLLYITCSLLRIENEDQVEAFLAQHENFEVAVPEKIWSIWPRRTLRNNGFFRLTPHQDGTDGFFAALLQFQK